MPDEQKRSVESLVSSKQIVDENMAIPFVNIWSGTGMPAETVISGGSLCSSNARNTIDERVLVDASIRAIEYHQPMITIDKNISGTYDTF